MFSINDMLYNATFVLGAAFLVLEIREFADLIERHSGVLVLFLEQLAHHVERLPLGHRQEVAADLRRVLSDVRLAVRDWHSLH